MEVYAMILTITDGKAWRERKSKSKRGEGRGREKERSFMRKEEEGRKERDRGL